MRIGREKSERVRVLVQQVAADGKVKKTQGVTVYEADQTEVFEIVEKALTEAARKKASR